MLSPASRHGRKPPATHRPSSLSNDATSPYRSPLHAATAAAAAPHTNTLHTPLLTSLNSPINVRVASTPKATTTNNLPLAIIYGIINTILTVPCMYGYALIIFSDPFFTDYTPQLCKLVLFSSAVHQMVFSLASSLPFAIGQVQDAGLLFLHAIATNIVKQGMEQQWKDIEIISTVVIGLAVSTSLLGFALLLIGKLKLANLVSYLPAPVVGGYLAFIGYFCLLSGFNLCTGLVFNANLNDAGGGWWSVWSWWTRKLYWFGPGSILRRLIVIVDLARGINYFNPRRRRRRCWCRCCREWHSSCEQQNKQTF